MLPYAHRYLSAEYYHEKYLNMSKIKLILPKGSR